MTSAINSTGAGKRGNPTKSSVPYTQDSTQRRARERSVAIQTLLLVRKSKSSSVKSKKIGRAVQQECRDRYRMPSSAWKKKLEAKINLLINGIAAKLAPTTGTRQPNS